ncbi:hypothetical protein BO94DRAFT_81382 [Aspergillus sclerotioniger CBS 115572]|uniref:Uncharacterized protein n=1 Tax=Aspergillus sclerotioniger CBS 115572 TaxID=1450535 RepID=A0A317WJ65_9EURO|nr:hypothetical protein BO94DRAFT_81382 [Aspergillus sclerotioniger CBS 115572]PWY86413.1 hypothetical protein BO94DRAFT_81382 [Aspergillus sclerotioniger CBS 115572]
MDYRSGRLTHTDAFPSSSSTLPRLHASPVVETVRPQQQVNPYRYEPSLDSRTHPTTTLRQPNRNPRPSSWRNHHRQASSRSSTLASQPVLVRAYSGSPHDTSSTTTMPVRRSFPFLGGPGSQRRGPALPSEEDFSIEGILRAIEPNIRHTLDSIGEICGRSRLSLANEYGSHIAPLGEIRAPPGGLLTVEEASSDHERQTDNVVIYDDETSVADGRDQSSFSHYRDWDNGRHLATGFQSRSPFSGDGPSAQVPPTTPRSVMALHSMTGGPLHTTRESTSKPRSCRMLLGKQVNSGSILTPALVSEILLDAQAEGNPINNYSLESPQGRRSIKPGTKDAKRWLPGWLQHGTLADGRQTTAEMRLRAMLERYQNTQNA